ncbi:MAG: hypothetical protein KF744_00240 [Taibaiella sp.]|nr:hypothetical protein [Taibaiella sp.]
MLRKASFTLILSANIASACTALAQPPHVARRIEHHNGNTFLFPGTSLDTVKVYDPITEETVLQVRAKPTDRPVAMNGKKIYNNAEVTSSVERRNDIIPFSFEEYLLNKIKPDLTTHADGSYRLCLDNIVVDKRGDVQYFATLLTRGERELAPNAFYLEPVYFYRERKTGADTLSVVERAIGKVLHTPLFVPARIDGRKVIACYESYTSKFEIVVKNHEITFVRDNTFPTVKSNI